MKRSAWCCPRTCSRYSAQFNFRLADQKLSSAREGGEDSEGGGGEILGGVVVVVGRKCRRSIQGAVTSPVSDSALLLITNYRDVRATTSHACHDHQRLVCSFNVHLTVMTARQPPAPRSYPACSPEISWLLLVKFKMHTIQTQHKHLFIGDMEL